jgi:hypothetical protein
MAVGIYYDAPFYVEIVFDPKNLAGSPSVGAYVIVPADHKVAGKYLYADFVKKYEGPGGLVLASSVPSDPETMKIIKL